MDYVWKLSTQEDCQVIYESKYSHFLLGNINVNWFSRPANDLRDFTETYTERSLSKLERLMHMESHIWFNPSGKKMMCCVVHLCSVPCEI